MTIAWGTTMSAVDAAYATGSTVEQRMGQAMRARLRAVGEVYDIAFPALTPTTLTESAEHASWASSHTLGRFAAITDLDELAAELDGNPPAAPTGDPTAVRARLLALHASTSGATRALVLAAIEAPIPEAPVEPRFYTAPYYERLTLYGPPLSVSAAAWRAASELKTMGAVELELVDVLTAAAAWLATV